ncbi:hypothetical protein PGH26_14975 [Sporosarcina jeotgali]|uniref:Uncharacterized protein n=1 Tax=Sporosarcina jeotgali TaxID=3020056 RepID=A0ABZ0KVT1_9BACL|nr:hypothetical protein [Sporosarcina sp. B2O-1]WOV84149.1 hypothetical protein PGH26_14975 [Sporosarcina sp. B2O-1]
MERQNIHPDEMSLRSNMDYIAMLHMIGEGAPDLSRFLDHSPEHPSEMGFDEHELPRDYQ